MDFQTIVTRLAEADNMGTIAPLSALEVVRIAELLAAPGVVDLRTPAQRVAFARRVPEVREALRQGQKIVAIKVLREASRGEGFIHTEDRDVMGLAHCRDAVEAL